MTVEFEVRKFNKERPELAKQLGNALTTWDKVVGIVKDKIEGYDKVLSILRELKSLVDSAVEIDSSQESIMADSTIVRIRDLKTIRNIPDCKGFRFDFSVEDGPSNKIEYQSYKDYQCFLVEGILPPSVKGSEIYQNTLKVTIFLNLEGRPECVTVQKEIGEIIKREDGFDEVRDTHLSCAQELSF